MPENSNRNILFDNLKGIAIFLVVLGHAFEWYLSFFPIKVVYLFIYSFHMPLFMFISGFFSKSKNSERNALVSLLPTYIFFELVYAAFLYFATGEASFSLLKPLSVFWYLVALIVYRVFFLKFTKTPVIIPFLFAIGIIIGFDTVIDGEILSLQRIFALSGFFILGYFTTPEKISSLRSWSGLKKAGIAITFILSLPFVASLFKKFTGLLSKIPERFIRTAD